MEKIFEEIDEMIFEEDERSTFGEFCDAFLGRKSVIVERLFPQIDASSANETFQAAVMRAYTDECENEKQTILKNLKVKRDDPSALKFYAPQLESVDKKLAIKTFQQLIGSLSDYLDKYLGLLETLNDAYIYIHELDGSEYIRENYVNYSIGYLLYRKHQSKNGRTGMLNMKYSKVVRNEYEKIGVDIEKVDPQFSKYRLISLNENIQIFNNKDNQAIKDDRIEKYFWINIPTGLLAKFEYLIGKGIIAEIAFRVDFVSDSLLAMEEKEFGYPMQLDITSLPELSKFYSTDNYDNNLWVQHDQRKQSLTFEELLDDFEVTGDDVVTQVVHLEYTSENNKFFITHLDHEFIIYTIDQYKERRSNSGVKGYRKVKTFKVDGSMIPFDMRLGEDVFLIQVLDSYFNNRDLIQEYFAVASV